MCIPDSVKPRTAENKTWNRPHQSKLDIRTLMVLFPYTSESDKRCMNVRLSNFSEPTSPGIQGVTVNGLSETSLKQ